MFFPQRRPTRNFSRDFPLPAVCSQKTSGWLVGNHVPPNCFSPHGSVQPAFSSTLCFNDWSHVPNRDSVGPQTEYSPRGSGRQPRTPPPASVWAQLFLPFTHGLCRVARQISIIHKQLSYLPQRKTQVFVCRLKINNLHSWVCSETPSSGWRCSSVWHRSQTSCLVCKNKRKKM